MDRFTQATTVAFIGAVLVTLLGACSDEYVCPQGSTSERGRCRFLPADDVGADAFPWPPADATVDFSEPPVIGNDVSGDAAVDPSDTADGAAPDGAADGAAPDGATDPSDAADAADAPGADGAAPDAGADTP